MMRLANLLPTRRWLRFGLRSLLFVTLVVSVALGWYVDWTKRQAAAVRMILDRGGSVAYTHQLKDSGNDELISQMGTYHGSLAGPNYYPRWGNEEIDIATPTWLRELVGD